MNYCDACCQAFDKIPLFFLSFPLNIKLNIVYNLVWFMQALSVIRLIAVHAEDSSPPSEIVSDQFAYMRVPEHSAVVGQGCVSVEGSP